MHDVGFLAALFAAALLLNLVWEFAHVRLYITKVSKVFLVWQSIKDAWWVTLAYLAVPHTLGFVALLLVFSYAVERHALLTKRWEYASEMPLVFGVGLSPLLELAVTGAVALVLTTTILGA